MHDVHLIQASAYDPHVEKSQPLGLMYLASYLQKEGLSPKITDMKIHDLRIEDVIRAYREDPVDFVGVSSITLDSRVAQALAKRIKRVNPNAFVVLGGAHATAYSEDVLQEGNMDAVVLYEGEMTYLDLLHARSEGRDLAEVPGIAFCRDGRPVITPARPAIDHLDSLPFPAWDLIPVEKYWERPRIAWIFNEREYMSIVTSRGCPFRCQYCHRTLGKKWRARGVDSIVEEMSILKKDYGIKEIVVLDDMFNLNKRRTMEFAQKLIDQRLNMKLHFPVGFRADTLTEEMVAMLKRAGMYRCMIAIETGSPRVQKLIEKNLDLEKAKNIVAKIADMGIMIHGVFMIGFPMETKEEMEQTMRFAVDSGFHSMAMSIAIPFKNSGLLELAKKDGISFEDKFERYSFTRSEVNLSRVPTDWVMKLRRRTYRKFFSAGRIIRFLRLLPHPMLHLGILIKVFIRKAFLW